MIDTLPSQEIPWLERFFSGRNELKWKAIVENNAPATWLEYVLPWIESFGRSKGRDPIVLPVFASGEPCQWYGMASGEAEANALAQELMAFVGPSYSNFKGQPLVPDLDDEIEKALSERFRYFVFCLEPINAEVVSKVTDALQLYWGMLQRRPDIPDRTQRPFGKIRAEFDYALLAGNEPDARRLRNELVSNGRIDAEQQKYLEIRMLAGLGLQNQLGRDEHLIKSVLGLRLPTQTLADLVDALYSTYIANIENSSNDGLILETFRKEVSDRFGSLFLERKGIRQPSVLKAFMLFELVQDEPNRERCQAIVSAYPEGEGRALVERWAQRIASKALPQIDLRESVRQALADEEYEVALQLSFDAVPAPWTYGAMLRCAVELDDGEASLKVIKIVNSIPESERLKWKKRDLSRLEQLRSETSCKPERGGVSSRTIRPEADWLSWAHYVESENYGQPPLQVLKETLPRWNIETYASDPETCRELAEKIGNASGKAEQTFRNAFAPLVEFFVERPERPERSFGSLYSMLIRIVAWSGVVTANELELASILVQGFVSLGPSKADYVDAVDNYAEILKANTAPANIDWALNAAEMLTLHPAPDRETRLRFFIAVVDMVKAYTHRLRPVQYEILSLLAMDYGCSDLLQTFPNRENATRELAPETEYSGLIAIYTLTVSAGQRAQDFLRQLLPVAKVEVNADHVATDKLKNLAANADIFVFAWKSSKHQAYFAVKDARGSKQILLPLGKGSASILNCVMGELGLNA